MRTLLSVLLLGVSLGTTAEAQSTKTVGELLSEGYQIRAAVAANIILQLDSKAYMCDLGGAWGGATTPAEHSSM